MKLNRYFPFAFIYFFFNSVALPFGLTYTTLLGPFFYIWVLLKRKKEILLPFTAVLLPFMIMHIFVIGVDLKSYFLSFLNITLVYFFCQAVYTFLKICPDPEKIFRKLLIINSILCVAALVFYLTPYHDLFWIQQNLTKGVGNVRRLRLFTYEPSYYATLFVPVFLFYLLQYCLRQNKMNNHLLLLMIFLPIVLSFSVGVIGSLFLSGIITFFFHFRHLAPKRRVVNSFIFLATLIAVSFVVIFFFFRNNAFFSRVMNIFSGNDTSGQGRTSDAFILAGKLLKEKSEYWGIGFGQVKIIGLDLIRSYYLYQPGTPVAIPNAAAETLATLGWVGLSARILLESFLFFYNRVWTNYFRLMLFLFMFIYQFTGSFITNAAEYVIWIMAFTTAFSQFDVKGIKSNVVTSIPQRTAG